MNFIDYTIDFTKERGERSMKEIVNRKNGTLTIEKLRPCRAEIRKEMALILEAMTELDKDVRVGKNAEIKLKELEKEFSRLCKLAIEEAHDERN